MNDKHIVTEHWLDRIDRPTALAIGKLLTVVWPRPGVTAADRADQMQQLGSGYDGPQEQTPRSFLVRSGGEVVIAHAASICRTIGTVTGDLTIAGLARVCAHPDCRGHGLGELVTRAVFDLVDEGAFPFSLFQTTPPVRAFYERLGCAVIENPIVNSLADAPTANPFKDPVIMRYPATGRWPDGTIDLRGPGY